MVVTKAFMNVVGQPYNETTSLLPVPECCQYDGMIAMPPHEVVLHPRFI